MERVTKASPGMEICWECRGERACGVCDGSGLGDGKRCGSCLGQKVCWTCKGRGQIVPEPGSSAGSDEADEVPPAARRATGLLPSRSILEQQGYMLLHACECGTRELLKDEAGEPLSEGRVLTRWTGTCGSCGRAREFEFDGPEIGPGVSKRFTRTYGHGLSEIIDPGEFLWLAEHHARKAPSDPAGLTVLARAYARGYLAMAVAAVDEALKFLPPGAFDMPAAAFTSKTGTEMWQAEPGRFSRARLEAYRRGLEQVFDRYVALEGG
jgi:hypothetical protein